MRVVADHVILEGESKLQGETDHQTRTRRTERPAFCMREEDDAEVMFPSLQRDCGQVANLRFTQNLFELGEGACGGYRERLGHFRQIMHGEDPALTVGDFGNVVRSPSPFQSVDESWRES